MNNAKRRLEASSAVLALIERRREQSGDETLGSAVERSIIARELREVEQDILSDPGALEPLLVPVRMGRRRDLRGR